MKKELRYFNIGSSYGGNQDWFSEYMMRLGGCGAETACDCCIYFDLYKGTSLYPFDINNLNKEDYKHFGTIMKPYLHPRMKGIDKLSIYIDGFGKYLSEKGSSITLSGIEGTEDIEKAKRMLKHQLDLDIPVPFLCLNHTNPRFKDYEWHWFIINGYEEFGDTLMVKAVTYSNWEWLDFGELWNSKKRNRGGMILIDFND